MLLVLCAIFAASLTQAAVSVDAPQLNGFEGGGSFAITNTEHNYGNDTIQLGWTSSGNTLTLSNSTLTTNGSLQLGSNTTNGNNHLVITDGSQLTVYAIPRPGPFDNLSTSSSIIISGRGSSLILTGGIVSNGPENTSAPITLKDGGLLKMPVGVFYQHASYPLNANAIRMDGGFYAIRTDRPFAANNTNWYMGSFYYLDDLTGEWTATLDPAEFNKHFAVTYYETDAPQPAIGGWAATRFSTPSPSLAPMPLSSAS